MDKYRKVRRTREENAVTDESEIRVTATGSVSAYISRAAKVYGELGKSQVVIKAQGNALTKAVTAAEVIKRRFKGLHQVSNVGQSEIVDVFEPLEEGLDKVEQTRNIPFIEITLSKDALDSKDKGYQAPIDESLVKEVTEEELTKPRGGGRGKGRGKGKGKAKGKGKGKGKEAPKGKGKGKGKEAPKGKGKGKGKDEPKGKGKGKAEPKGKSKGKGDKGKGKGKSSYSNSYDRGYDDWYGQSKGYSSKGKGKSKGWTW